MPGHRGPAGPGGCALPAGRRGGGGIAVAELSQAELCALGAERVSLVCPRSARWWAGLGEDGRRALGRRALALLAARGLLRLPAGAGAADLYEAGQLTNDHLSPALFLILAARRATRPVVACYLPGQDLWCHPRFFGITTPAGALQALVCEVLTEEPAGPGGQPLFGTVLRYTLLSPARAAQMITAWARLTIGAMPGAEVPAVTVTARTGAGLRHEQYRIRAGGLRARERRQRSAGGRRAGRSTLARRAAPSSPARGKGYVRCTWCAAGRNSGR